MVEETHARVVVSILLFGLCLRILAKHTQSARDKRWVSDVRTFFYDPGTDHSASRMIDYLKCRCGETNCRFLHANDR